MDIPGYLRRIGLPGLLGAPPSAEALRELHVGHVERVPYETLEIWLGRTTSVDPFESAARILRGRGGYCYHLNGAFAELLRGLGYEVTRHVGGVQNRGAEPGVTGNHLALTVRLPDGDWLVDLGLGDALHEPLPLTEGRYRQGPFEYGLRPSQVAPGGWRFDHDPSGSFLGMDFAPAPAEMSAFTKMHDHLCTSPDSGFVRVLSVLRRDAMGVDLLRGAVLSRLGTRSTAVTLESEPDYYAALADVFHLPLDDLTTTEKGMLWKRVRRSHEEWLSHDRKQ
ncbi:arylamine N-acetyltransferase [Nonomuraea sp. NPDC046570]|uniref:arylamine N-acetyltransferase family protein n=1 Tax=Nonomuraea sp. NPDC046570 TaxID=3155255 RepID=UPI0034020596